MQISVISILTGGPRAMFFAGCDIFLSELSVEKSNKEKNEGATAKTMQRLMIFQSFYSVMLTQMSDWKRNNVVKLVNMCVLNFKCQTDGAVVAY